LSDESTSKKPPIQKKRLPKSELGKFDSTPLYFYTEKDGLNRVTVLKESGKEAYLITGRYAKFENDARLNTPLTDEEKAEIEKNLRMGRKDASVSFL